MNEQKGVTLYSPIAKYFKFSFWGSYYISTKKFDASGNLTSSSIDSSASLDFWNKMKLLDSPDGRLIAIERPTLKIHKPYIALRYDAEGKFIDSNEVIPVIKKNDTTLKVYTQYISVTPSGDVCVLAETDKAVNNMPIDGLTYSSIFYLDKDKQKIKWVLPFNQNASESKDFRLAFRCEPVYYSNGDISAIISDVGGKKSDGGKIRLSLLRVDTTGNTVSRKVIKHIKRLGDLPTILAIHINKYDEVILVGKIGDEQPIGYFAKIDTTGKLIFEEKFKPEKKYHYTLEKIVEYEPNKYVIAGMEERAENKQDSWAVFYKFEDNTGAAKSSVEESKEAETLLFPNPAYNTITLSDYDGAELQIYDIEGKLVLSNIFSSEIDVSALSAGTYYVRCGKKSYKFIKK